MRGVVFGLLTLLAVPAVWGQETAPTEASIKRLFEIMHTSKLLDGVMAQMDQMMHASIRESLQGQTLNAEQQQIIDDMGSELVGLMKENLDWTILEPQMVEVYRKTFTRQEVDGMLTFYRSPTGQAVIDKMPATVKQMMQLTQQRMGNLQPKIAQLQRDTMAALKRAQTRADNGDQSGSPASPTAPPPAPH